MRADSLRSVVCRCRGRLPYWLGWLRVLWGMGWRATRLRSSSMGGLLGWRYCRIQIEQLPLSFDKRAHLFATLVHTITRDFTYVAWRSPASSSYSSNYQAHDLSDHGRPALYCTQNGHTYATHIHVLHSTQSWLSRPHFIAVRAQLATSYTRCR